MVTLIKRISRYGGFDQEGCFGMVTLIKKVSRYGDFDQESF